MKFILFKLLVINLIIFVQQGHSAGIDPATIVGIWLLDEEKGEIVKDYSANGFDGQIKGTKKENGVFGKALNFTKGDTVTINLGKGTITNKVTVVMWVKFTDLSGQQNYYSIWDQSDHRYVPYKTLANEFHFWSNSWDVGSGFFAMKDKWNHVANIYDGSKVSIIIDGELKTSQPVAGFTLGNEQQTSWLATDRGGWISACVIDDVGLFNIALTEENVKNIMRNGIAKVTGIVSVDVLGSLATSWGRIKN